MDKSQAIKNNMVSLAKSKNAKMRSKMLKMIMPLLSRENGQKLAEAIHKKNVGLFDSIWNKIRNIIDEKLEATAADTIDLDELYELMTEDFDSLASDMDDSYLLNSNSTINQKTCELASNGTAYFKKENDIYKLSITSSDIGNVDTYVMKPEATMKAVFENLSTNEEGEELQASGTIGHCFTDLVIKAMQKL